MTKIAELAAAVRTATDPADRCDAAIALLDATTSRQQVDFALATLAQPDVRVHLSAAHQRMLRAKAWHYFDGPPDKDKGGLIREAILRLLIDFADPGDSDLYQRGATTYHHQPVYDSAQGLRAASLIGLASVNVELSYWYAVKLLGEPDTSHFNGEPGVTAVNVLARAGQRLPLYQFALRAAPAIGIDEGIERALEVLSSDFPTTLYADLVARYREFDAPLPLRGIITGVIESASADLYPLLADIIRTTANADLHHYAVVMLGAARRPALTSLLHELAKTAPTERIPAYIEALGLTPAGDARDDLLALLRRRR